MSKPTQSLMTSDVGTLWVGEGFPWFFKCPVVGPPCDLTRILGDVIVCVIKGLSRRGADNLTLRAAVFKKND